jgi:hypothetical protein
MPPGLLRVLGPIRANRSRLRAIGDYVQLSGARNMELAPGSR